MSRSGSQSLERDGFEIDDEGSHTCPLCESLFSRDSEGAFECSSCEAVLTCPFCNTLQVMQIIVRGEGDYIEDVERSGRCVVCGQECDLNR